MFDSRQFRTRCGMKFVASLLIAVCVIATAAASEWESAWTPSFVVGHGVWHEVWFSAEERGAGGVSSESVGTIRPTGSRVLARPDRVLVFTTSWCDPCKRMAKDVWPLLKNLQPSPWDIADRADAHFELIDADTDPRTQQFHVTSLPTLIKLDRQGREVRRAVGFQTATQCTSFWYGTQP